MVSPRSLSSCQGLSGSNPSTEFPSPVQEELCLTELMGESPERHRVRWQQWLWPLLLPFVITDSIYLVVQLGAPCVGLLLRVSFVSFGAQRLLAGVSLGFFSGP